MNTSGKRVLQLFDVEGDVNRLDPLQPVNSSALAPGEKLPDVIVVGDPGVLVANRCGEEFQTAACGVFAGVGDERRNGRFRRVHGEGFGGLIGDELAHGFSVT